ncbi:MAG: AAA family ATPase, partial [Dehalococcoidia bacterium]|nr:AAA family ATPase [Dehalococcoidia bacterium]
MVNHARGQTHTSGPPPLPSHEELVRQLLRPQAYPETVSQVRLLQTHISSLFFTGDHVYKVKKPVNYGFLDFTTLSKRRYYCRQELTLNRRLSPDIYLGVVEIREQGGQLTIGGQGRTVEYAVKMRQLPTDRALAALLKAGAVSTQDISRLGELVADFHGRANTSPAITQQGGFKAVTRNIRENFRQTRRYIGLCLTQDEYDDMVAYSQAFMATRANTFLRRAAEGRIRDGHGDLHTGAVFLANGIYILDCIEFNRRFRYGDVASDVAFPAMDLDFHGRRDLSTAFVQAYIQASCDTGVEELLDFFKSYRAYVRAKVTSFRLDDPLLSPTDRKEALATAQAYYRLAHSYTRVIPQPSLFLVAGLMGTGKSTVAQDLARRQNAAYISSDVTRKSLEGIAPTEHRYESFREGIYAPSMSRRTYDAMLSQAREHLATGRSVVLDATFRQSQDRRMATDLPR